LDKSCFPFSEFPLEETVSDEKLQTRFQESSQDRGHQSILLTDNTATEFVNQLLDFLRFFEEIIGASSSGGGDGGSMEKKKRFPTRKRVENKEIEKSLETTADC
jgi:hypothetical protein